MQHSQPSIDDLEIKLLDQVLSGWGIVRAIQQILCVLLLLGLSVFSCPLLALALSVQDVPNPRQISGEWVTDMAHLLDAQTKTQLNQAISKLEQDEGIEMAVVTVPETRPSPSPQVFATRLFNHWGIGKPDQNNGILLLVSAGDRQVEIKTGSGIVALLPNMKLQSIIDHDILPQFRAENFSEGIWLGTQSLIRAVHTVPSQIKPAIASPPQPHSTAKSRAHAPLLVAGIIVASVAFLCLVVFWGIVVAFQPVKVEPEGRSSQTNGQRDNALNCARCHLAMRRVSSQTLLTYLTPAQHKAQELGGVVFEGWHCPPECKQETPPSGVHLREYIVNDKQFKCCLNCKERTMERSVETITPASRTEEGKRLIKQHCHSCSLTKEHEEAIKPGYPVYDADGVYMDSVAYSPNSSNSFGGGSYDSGGGAGGGW
jgi:uncharacterized protein